jgi:hypothetical protein
LKIPGQALQRNFWSGSSMLASQRMAGEIRGRSRNTMGWG